MITDGFGISQRLILQILWMDGSLLDTEVVCSESNGGYDEHVYQHERRRD
jgi:hypothetical protein